MSNASDAGIALPELSEVTIHTDGACIGNPGRGGYGVVLSYNGQRRELSAGFRRTTNNRMEILAAIVGLEALKEKCRVVVYSDSQYLVNAIHLGWAEKWKLAGWKRNGKQKALNPDLWDRLLSLCGQHEAEFVWVRGHAGNRENERCDRLAVAAAKSRELLVDEPYENLLRHSQRSTRMELE